MDALGIGSGYGLGLGHGHGLGSKLINKKQISFGADTTDHVTLQADSSARYTPLTRSDFDKNIVEKWIEIRCANTPSRRCNHISFIHQTWLYVHGGADINKGKMSDTYRISLAQSNFTEAPKWNLLECTGVLPEAMSHQAGAMVGETYYMVGGELQTGGSTNNIYMFHVEKSKWEKRIFVDEDLPSISGHTCNYYNPSNSLILFGGYSKGTYLNSVYMYDVNKNDWSKFPNDKQNNSDEKNILSPIGRVAHSSVIWNEFLFVYGGQNLEADFLSDMWKFNLVDKTWQNVIIQGEIPKGRSGHISMGYGDDIFIFGGKIGNIREINELWRFDPKVNSFTLLHDTLLEQFADIPETTATSFRRSNSNRKCM
jgi:N-acetylneuraminic acid mutarotase